MSKKASPHGGLQRCRRALDSSVTQKEWKDIFGTLKDLALGKGQSESVRVRAAELLLRYRFGPPTEPAAEEEDVQPIKIIRVMSSKDRPPEEYEPDDKG